MITGYYIGWNVLTVEESFKITAWESIYSSFADDPLFLSISNFAKICNQNNIKVDYFSKNNRNNLDSFSVNKIPLLIIISGYSEEKEVLINMMKKGANIVYIKPEFGVVINQDQQSKFDEFEKWIFERVGLNLEDKAFRNVIQKGNLFYLKANQINDYQIEDGPFGRVEKTVVENKLKNIRSIVKEISHFNVPYIDVNIESIPSTFPLNEPILIDFSIKNVSNISIDSLIVEIEMPKSFEPITSTYWEMNDVNGFAFENMPIYCKPKKKGLISEFITVRVEINKEKEIIKKVLFELEIIDNFRFILRKSLPHNIDTKKLIEKYHTHFKDVIDQDSFLKLMEIDPEGLIVKTRKIAEDLTKKIARDKLENFNSRWSFSDLIKKLFAQKIINNKTRSYLETIRLFGNIAAHSDIDDPANFSNEDSIVISNALLIFIKECLNMGLID
jgi:hypothetical protein